MGIESVKWIPWLPALAAVLCGLCCTRRGLRRLAAPICIGSIGGAFVLTVLAAGRIEPGTGGLRLHMFDWIHVGGFRVDFAYFIDPLTILMLMVITGVGTLVAVYAAGYMAGDRGYARFFAAVSLFIFAMTALVMADNLVLLYLGWEGVGLCSYLLIGFYYDRPSAVAAAKKAFIVNRIGDLGFALGIMLIFHEWGTVQFADVEAADGTLYTGLFGHWAQMPAGLVETPVLVIPFLLMLGAFGKSAQLPLYVWLPDAMEGPTPVSALIHAATMVTAGVYLIARLVPLFELSPYALPTVAVVGGLTAFFAATIALCQNDIKRVFAYSTISQLGYMFLGVGVVSTVSGVFHLFTHAFFKALLFLTAGSVMHGLAGQLDMRKMSGLRSRMPVTCGLMFVGCLALAGFPFTAGFFSKDMILAEVFAKGIGDHLMLYQVLGWLGLFTALLTAFYTFRLWFRVFAGPLVYEIGDEHGHGHDGAHGDDAAGGVEHVHEPHEMPWRMNAPLLVLAVGALLTGWLGHAGADGHSWVERMVMGSTARPTRVHAGGHGEAALFGMELHTALMVISSVVALTGIGAAAYFHWWNRAATEHVARRWAGLVGLLRNKYYVDEFNDRVIVQPLRAVGYVCYIFDRLIIDGLVLLVGLVPRLVGRVLRPAQHGSLQGYGIGMAAGVGVVLLIVLLSLGMRPLK